GLDVCQGSAQHLGKIIDDMSGGRLKIQVFAGGELMPAFGCFDAACQGTIECFMGAPYYWAGKEPAMQWFSAVPFSLNPQGMMTWYLHGDGLKLWEETYAAFNLVPRPGPSTGVQMAGWFRKKMNSIADYKGLKMRIPGLGGKIVAAAGGTGVPGDPGPHAHGVRVQEHRRPAEAQDRVQGQGGDPAAVPADPEGAEETRRHGPQGRVREEPAGQEGLRLGQEVRGDAQ